MSDQPISSYDPNETRLDYIKRMEAEGNRIVLPADDELLIDLDSQEHIDAFKKSWPIFERDVLLHVGIAPTYTSAPSRSGPPRTHVTVKLPFEIVTPEERIAWQAALGSDPVRELLSMLRDMRGDEHPTLFVEKA
jgi:hypothetical protein